MRILTTLTVTASAMMLLACQSESFKLEGSAEMLTDGDTIFITDDLSHGTPTDTLVIADGVFKTEGPADSTTYCLAYSPKVRNAMITFFKEKGAVRVHIAGDPTQSHVGGTPTNDLLQEFNDSTEGMEEQAKQLIASIDRNTMTDEEVEPYVRQIEKLSAEYSEMIMKAIEKNIGNEFGLYLLYSHYGDIDEQKHLELINSLPEAKQAHKEIQKVKAIILPKMKYAVGKTVDDFTMNDMKGTPTSLMAEVAKHKITIIDFWASWCGPCRQEMPSLVKLYAAQKANGLGIVGISLDKEAAAWKEATKELGMEWVQLSDLNGWQNAAARMYSINSIPSTIIVDSKGNILAKNLRGKALEDFIAEKLAKQ